LKTSWWSVLQNRSTIQIKATKKFSPNTSTIDADIDNKTDTKFQSSQYMWMGKRNVKSDCNCYFPHCLATTLAVWAVINLFSRSFNIRVSGTSIAWLSKVLYAFKLHSYSMHLFCRRRSRFKRFKIFYRIPFNTFKKISAS